MAEVGIDPDLGLVRATRVVAGVDGGRILNEKTAASQITGGTVGGDPEQLLWAAARQRHRQPARTPRPGPGDPPPVRGVPRRLRAVPCCGWPGRRFAIQPAIPRYPQVSSLCTAAMGYPLAPWAGFAVLCA